MKKENWEKKTANLWLKLSHSFSQNLNEKRELRDIKIVPIIHKNTLSHKISMKKENWEAVQDHVKAFYRNRSHKISMKKENWEAKN